MNCCDEYGNCRQGRDCPIKKHREMAIDDEVDLSFTPVIVVLFCIAISIIGIVWGA